MKKHLLFIAFSISTIAAAQVTTGTINFASGFSGQVDINDTDVTITMVNDDDRWMAMGFDTTSMTNGKDVVTFDDSGFNDRRFTGIGSTPPTDTQDWTVVSNDVAGGTRTLIATRPLAGSDATDFTFDPDASTLAIAWARGAGLNFVGHGQGNRGSTVVNFTLNVDGVVAQTVSLFPIPANDILTVSLQNIDAQDATISLYSITGALVMESALDHKSTILDVSTIAQGTYIVKVITNEGAVFNSRFIKE